MSTVYEIITERIVKQLEQGVAMPAAMPGAVIATPEPAQYSLS